MNEEKEDLAQKSADSGAFTARQKVNDDQVTYLQRPVRCGMKRCKRCRPEDGSTPRYHGPYWYMVCYLPKDQSTKIVYIGKRLDMSKYRNPDGSVDWPSIPGIRAKSAPADLGSGNPIDEIPEVQP